MTTVDNYRGACSGLSVGFAQQGRGSPTYSPGPVARTVERHTPDHTFPSPARGREPNSHPKNHALPVLEPNVLIIRLSPTQGGPPPPSLPSMLSSPLLALLLMSPPCQMTLPLQESETGFRSSLFTHTTNSLLFQLQFPQNLEWIAGAALQPQRPCSLVAEPCCNTPTPLPQWRVSRTQLSPPATSQGQTSLSGCPHMPEPFLVLSPQPRHVCATHVLHGTQE